MTSIIFRQRGWLHNITITFLWELAQQATQLVASFTAAIAGTAGFYNHVITGSNKQEPAMLG